MPLYSRMFRNPHVALGSVRPLLLGPAVAHACCRCNGAAAASFFHKDRAVHETEGPVADGDNGSRSVNLAANRLKADFFLPQDCLPSSSSNPKLFGASRLAFDARSSEAVFKHLAAQNHKTISSPHGCSQQAAKCLLQPCKSHHHHHHPLLSRVAAGSQRHPALLQRNSAHRELFLRPFSTVEYRSRWSLNHLHCSSSSPPQQCTPSCFGAQFRAQLHGAAAPRQEASLKDCLSLENEQRCRRALAPNQKLYEAAGDDTKARRSQGRNQNQGRWKASVLVSLCSVEEQPAFLFTLRSNALKGRHKGDVSFAGGKSDQADKDVVDTALREAQEELGITVDKRQVWGVLKPLRDMSGMLIAPVLANLGPLEALSFKPNPQEVEEIFTVSLSHMYDTRNRGYTHFRTGDKYGYTLPVFRNGKHRVWGLTAVALDHTLKIIVPPQTTPSRS